MIAVSVDDTEVRALLATIERKFVRRTVNRGLRRTAKILRAVALPATPRKTGRLRRAVKVRRLRNAPRGQAAVAVIIGRKWFAGATFYGAFVEWGHGVGKRSSAVALMHKRRSRGRATQADVDRVGDPRRRARPRLMLTNAARTAGSFALRAGVEVIRQEVESIRRGKGLDRGEEGGDG